jgi:hypothetical protein
MRDVFISRFCLVPVLLCVFMGYGSAQSKRTYWQQAIKYSMDVALDVETNQVEASQSITYKNNSPDELKKIYFHLYFNAFQPGSDMDVRSRNLPDPDARVGSRIVALKPEEQGYHKMKSIRQGGTELKYKVEGTIMEVILAKPLRAGGTLKLEMEYMSQVPIQIRRSGRDNAEGIRYSMAQWYPKVCEYDEMGWHTNPYIGREFYGVWGDFDVRITLDSAYTVAATGYLKNSNQMGHGYGGHNQRKSRNTTWEFSVRNVHDFVWAADPDYHHDIYVGKYGLTFHMFYQGDEPYATVWKQLPVIMDEAYGYIKTHYGEYPYGHYSFIQGGDGGMEYPMATLMTGNRSLGSVVGTGLHEFLHSWYHGMLGFNESLYFWMDEGFTNYTEEVVKNHLRTIGSLPGGSDPFIFENDFKSYYVIHTRGIEEPLVTHADHFEYNQAYNFAAYTKGGLFLHQLEYIIGRAPFGKGLLDFYDRWKFKHPDPTDFIRVMEMASDMELDWYKEYFIHTLKTIDYAIDTLESKGNSTAITLRNIGRMPMPIDIMIESTDGERVSYTIPIDLMRGAKMEFDLDNRVKAVLPDWNWVQPEYKFDVPMPFNKIGRIIIDPERRFADMDRTNNTWPATAAEE